jgi:hypothetical protein
MTTHPAGTELSTEAVYRQAFALHRQQRLGEARLMAEMIELFDRSRFELSAFSLDANAQDAVTRRLQGAFDRFIEVGARSDREIALLARRMEVDIAVDLGGFTSGSRTAVFASRAAPALALRPLLRRRICAARPSAAAWMASA